MARFVGPVERRCTEEEQLKLESAVANSITVPVTDRLGGIGDQRDLARQAGRPDCGFSRSAPHRLGGSGSHAREGLRLVEVRPLRP